MKRFTVAALALIASFPALANGPNQQLLALSEQEKHAALSNYVRQGGETCDAVVRSMPRHSAAGEPAFWDVGCRDGKTYSVVISPQPGQPPLVQSCEALKKSGKMLADMARRARQRPAAPYECWKKS